MVGMVVARWLERGPAGQEVISDDGNRPAFRLLELTYDILLPYKMISSTQNLTQVSLRERVLTLPTTSIKHLPERHLAPTIQTTSPLTALVSLPFLTATTHLLSRTMCQFCEILNFEVTMI